VASLALRPRRSPTGLVRKRLLPPLAAALAAFAVAQPAAARPSPAEQAQQAHARHVLAEIQTLDANLERTVQAWDGANLRLASLDRQVRANRTALKIARRQLKIAQARLAQRLVVVYKTGEPSALDVLVGAKSISQLIDGMQAAQRVVGEDKQIAHETEVAAKRFQLRRSALLKARTSQRRTVGRLASSRAQIESGLSQRRTLLASIKNQIAQIQAQERAHERYLAAVARARIAREQRAIAAQRAREAREQKAAQQQQQQEQQQEPAPAQTTTAPVAPTTTAASPAPAPPTPAPTPAPAPSAGGGHPEAASIAARYLGVPYRWGGSTPAGFDCSGLVSYVYAQLGISLPHYTGAQWSATRPISRADLQPGDLVFFDGLGHVGIYIGGDQFIHAPHTGDVVRVQSLSDSWYASHFDGARRVP
jgi:cell wall-associated NlpC family hydrolase